MVSRHRPSRALVIGDTDGIGRALVLRLLGEGWHVLGVSRRASTIEHPADGRYRHHVLDASSEGYRAALAELVAPAPAELGAAGCLDLCVYCAGVGEAFDPTDLSNDALAARVNFVGLVDTAAAVIPAMVRDGAGHFMGLSSIGDGASPSAPAYGASKAGASAYLAGLALALRPHGVYVTNVRFGFVDTKMAKAPVKPMMIAVDDAVRVLMRAIAKRPAVVSYPRTMAWLVGALQWVLRARLRLR